MNPALGSAAMGAAGGFAGALLGHVAVDLAFRFTGDASAWFKGPHGPPFFSLVVNTAVFYACLGAALARPGARRRAAAWCFAAGFVPIWLPMSIVTRAFAWGEAPGEQATLAWFYCILGSYFAACAAAAWSCGAVREGGLDRRAGAGAALGSLAAYLAGVLLAKALPALKGEIAAPRRLPPFGMLFNGLSAGALAGAGASLLARGPAAARKEAP